MTYNQIEIYPSPVKSKAYDVRVQTWASDWNFFSSLEFVIYSKEFSGFAVYPSTHTDAQILANAAAWGLA